MSSTFDAKFSYTTRPDGTVVATQTWGLNWRGQVVSGFSFELPNPDFMAARESWLEERKRTAPQGAALNEFEIEERDHVLKEYRERKESEQRAREALAAKRGRRG